VFSVPADIHGSSPFYSSFFGFVRQMNAKKAVILLVTLASAFTWTGVMTSAQAADLPTTFEYNVLGWTDNSELWGFQEKGDYGCGMIYSPGGGIYVIDAAKNDFVFENFEEVGEWENEDDELKRKAAARREGNDLEAAEKTGLLGKMGTVVFSSPKMVWVDYDSHFKQFGSRTVNFHHGSGKYEIQLRDSFLDDPDTMSGKKSKFSLSIRKDKGQWTILQSDKSHWRPYLAYRIVYVSISPNSKNIAVLIEAVENALESQKQSFYKGVTGLLPIGKTGNL
jgi:hypothetical protein